MKVKMLDDRLLVARLEPETKTPGGIVLPDQSRGKSMRGKVLATGLGRWRLDGLGRIPMAVKDGDTILFRRHAGIEVEDQGAEDLVILTECDVLAVMGGS